MNRLSSFTIISDPLPDGNKVLMNGCSGAIDIIPPQLAVYFEHLLETHPRGEAYVEEDLLSLETCASLHERGHLTHITHEQEKSAVAEIARGLHELEKKRPYFMIVPNMDCNYRCVYCFERYFQRTLHKETSKINYHKNNVVLQRDAVPRIYSCIEEIQRRAGSEPGGMINLYGGEPLDARNKDLVNSIVSTGEERGYWFVGVTNGHDLEAFLPIIERNALRKIQVTLDGPKRIHDKRRIYRGKGSSFDKIFANINKVLSAGGHVDIRVHVSPDTIPHFEEVLSLFEKEGWTNNDSVIIYANTLYRKDGADKVCVDLEVADISRQLDSMVGHYNNVFTSAPALHIAQAITPVFETGDRFALHGAYCGANFGHYIFAPDENIYVCWESIGKESCRIGSYQADRGLLLEQSAIQKWFNRCVADVDGCLDCEFALVCGGGCAQYAEYNDASLNRPYCNDFHRTFAFALADEVARRSMSTDAEGLSNAVLHKS
jgi:uncharacterized protein